MRMHQVTILALGVLLFSACKDEASEIGKGLFPDNEIISTHEYISKTTDIETSNIQSNSIQFSLISSFIIGEFDDPEFGKTKADFLSQLSVGTLNSYRIKRGEHYTLDSTKVLLKIINNSWIGDINAKHKINIYELTNPLDPFEKYSSDLDLTEMYDPTKSIGEIIFNARNEKTDSVLEIDNYVDSLFIDIDDEIGNKLFEADSAIITNRMEFRQFFNGLYITSEKVDDNTVGSLIKLDYRSYNQGLMLYYTSVQYKTNTDSTIYNPSDFTPSDKKFITDTITEQNIKLFPINIEDVKVNRYSHDYTNSKIDFGNSATEKLFVQPMAGSSCKLHITSSFIEYWKKNIPKRDNEGNIIIADTTYSIAGTTLTLYIDTTNTDYRNYPPPASLDIFVKNDKGDYITPLFENEFGQITAAYSSGILSNAITEEGVVYPNKYTFTLETGFFEEFIDPQFQGNIDRTNLSDLYIVPQNSSSNFNRVVLHSAAIKDDDTSKSVKMSVKYVKLR